MNKLLKVSLIFTGSGYPYWFVKKEDVFPHLVKMRGIVQKKRIPITDRWYRGITVTIEEKERLHVYDEIVEVINSDSEEMRSFLDSERKFEKHLFETAKPHINNKIYESVKSEMNRV